MRSRDSLSLLRVSEDGYIVTCLECLSKLFISLMVYLPEPLPTVIAWDTYFDILSLDLVELVRFFCLDETRLAG